MTGQAYRLNVAEPPRTADVVVVGGGIVGAATAFFTTRAGLETVVLEARPRLASLTTAAATGSFRLQFDNAEEIALVREGVSLFEAFGDRTGLAGYDIGLRRAGYLFCSRDEGHMSRQARLVELQRAAGLTDVELLPGDEVRRRFPFVSPDVVQARFRAGDGLLDQVRVAYGYAYAASGGPGIERPAATARATFCLGERAIGFERTGERLTGVVTAHARIAAAAVVLATGPFLARTAALAGLTLDLRPTRRQKLVLPDVPEVPTEAPMTIDEGSAAHWRPALLGAYALCTEPDVAPTEPSWNVPTSADFAFRILDPASPQSIAHVSPFWSDVWARGTTWFLQAGQYEYTPDRRPYIGRTGIDGLWLNGGYSGHGVMASPGGSRLLVDLLTGRSTAPTGSIDPASADANPFRLDRPMADREHDVL